MKGEKRRERESIGLAIFDTTRKLNTKLNDRIKESTLFN